MANTIPLDEETIRAFRHLLERTIAAVAALDATGRTGGAYCLRKNYFGSDIYIDVVGALDDPAKKRKYLDFAHEKSVRLIDRSDDISSFQSRDPAREKWGGAIRTKGLILSFSGLPELVDEAYMLAVAVKLGWCSPLLAKRIIQKSQNSYYEKVWHIVDTAI